LAGYSGTPLVKKIGIKEGYSVAWVDAPATLKALIEPLPEKARLTRKVVADHDCVHWFTKSADSLEIELPKLKKKIKDSGMIWVSWPKKSSGVRTDITEDMIRECARRNGLVDVKVCGRCNGAQTMHRNCGYPKGYGRRAFCRPMKAS